MFLSRYFRSLRWRADHKRPIRGWRPQRSFIPQLAVLEDRTVPSTFMVTNLSDSDPGSLRAAIMGADTTPGADVIKFAHGLHGTISLTSGELSITDDLTIDGPGVNKLT